MARVKSDRPTTAGAVGTRLTSNWGYAGQPQASGRPGEAARPVDPRGEAYVEPVRARPHTAHAGLQQADPRAGKVSAAAAPPGEEDDAHVVAGARAMMRYRRTRASSAEGGGSATGPGSQSNGQPAAQGQIKGWTGDLYGQQQAQGGKAPASAGQMTQVTQQQVQLLQQQQIAQQQAAQRKMTPAPTQPTSMSGWIGGSTQQVLPPPLTLSL